MKYLVDNRTYMPAKNPDGSIGAVHAHLTQVDEEGVFRSIEFDEAEARALSLEINGDEDAITPVIGLTEDVARTNPEVDDSGSVVYDQTTEESTMSNDNNIYLVKNTGARPVFLAGQPVGPVHEYITAAADKDTGLPVAFSLAFANEVAEMVDGEVVLVSDTGLTAASVILHPSARKLPTTQATLHLEQVTEISM